MEYIERFSDSDLERIIDEATVYMCACPAQVAVALRNLRGLYRYQIGCLKGDSAESEVHRLIADSTVAAHEELQDCLDRVLTLEQWDRTHWRMPEGLRQRRDRIIDEES